MYFKTSPAFGATYTFAFFFVLYLLISLTINGNDIAKMDKYVNVGPYKVGAREFWTTRTKNECIVFYPID